MKSVIIVAVLALILGLALAEKAEFSKVTLDVYESSFPEENILPHFMFSQGSVEGGGTSVVLNPNGGRGAKKPSSFDWSLPNYYLEGLMGDVRSPVLPYRLQSHWNCDADTHNVKRAGLKLETSKISATITPEVNGKVWELYDKVHQKDMVQAKIGKDRQRSFANIGTHKMWGSGGIEVNWSPGIIGHSAFAEREVFAAQFETERGPVVRTYEFDRFNFSTFQVDWFVEDDILYMHPKVINPHDHPLPAYWWTCVANPVGGQDSQERIVSPVDHVAQTETTPIRYSTWPDFSPGQNSSFHGRSGEWAIDHSYQSNIIWGDFFLDVIPSNDKWIQISYLSEEDKGYSVFHGHPNNGTKFFTWGNNGNSVYMQRFLGNFQPNSNYVELQTGLMKTQSQQASIPSAKNGGALEWTEYFKGWMPTADEKKALDSDIYAHAVNATQDWSISDRGIPYTARQSADEFLKSLSSREIKREEIVYYGSQWGALHNKLMAHFGLPTIGANTPFFFENDKVSDDVRPWDELLTSGTFSPASLNAIPTSFQVADEWKTVLVNSMTKFGSTWLHLFHLAVIDMEQGGVEQAKLWLKQSISLKPTPHAYRCLALLQDNDTEALNFLLKAWDLAYNTPVTLANRDRLVYYVGSEIASFLQATGLTGKTKMREELKKFVEEQLFKLPNIPTSLLNTDQVLSSQVAIALWFGRPDDVLGLLSDDTKNCFPTYGRQRSELADYWNAAQIAIKEKQINRPLTIAEQRDVIMTQFPPQRVGCAYASWYSLNPKCWF